MKTLKEKIRISLDIINTAIKKFPNEKIVIAWTGGKDSTVLLHLVRSIFNDTVPFPVMFNDSTMEFPEVTDFIKTIKKLWSLKLVVIEHDKTQLKKFYTTKSVKKRQELSRLMKIQAINNFIKKNPIDAFMVGIRWDEHPARAKEVYFSQREGHVRIHPILHFTESDIWDYIQTFKVPYVNLYDQGYRSLGEKPFTNKAQTGQGERSGREYDKEQMMNKLRSLGYW